MAQYIDKDAALAKIDSEIKLLEPYLGACAGQIVAEANSKNAAYNRVKDILNTLDMKVVGLDFLIHEEYDAAAKTEYDCIERAAFTKFEFTQLVKRIFELGLNAQKGE